MDLVRGIFKQKIAAFFAFLQSISRIHTKPPSPPGLKITAQEQSLRVILKRKGEECGGGWMGALNVKGGREGLD